MRATSRRVAARILRSLGLGAPQRRHLRRTAQRALRRRRRSVERLPHDAVKFVRKRVLNRLRSRVRKRVLKPLKRQTPAQQRDRVRLRRAGALEPLEHFTRAQPVAALRPNWSDLWFLYELVRKRRPTTLLEFGSGCSTAVLAAAVRDNGVGHLWSIEADADWADVTERALADPLRPLVTVVRSAAVEDDRDVCGWSHSNIPDVEPDFLYLDSPPLTRERRVAFDPLDLEQRFRPGFVMVVDGRRSNALYLRDCLKREYRFRHVRLVGDPGRFLFELGDNGGAGQ